MRTPIQTPRPADVLISLSICTLVAGLALIIAHAQPYPNALDELGHYAYARHIAETWNLHPALHVIQQDGGGAFYLNHPPAYYALLAPAFELCAGDPHCLRQMNAPLGALTVALIFFAFRRAGLGPAAAGLLVLPILAIPVFVFMPAWINNDNLAYLAGALATWAAAGRLAGRGVNWSILALALALAGLAKANALLGVGVLAAGLLVDDALTRRRPDLRASAWLAFGALVAAIPYAAFISAYGDPVPNTRALTDTLSSGDGSRHTDRADEFLLFFWTKLAGSLIDPFRSLSAWWVERAILAGLWLAPLGAAIRGRGTARGRFFLVVTIALWAQTLVHMDHIWGYLGAVHIRYYMHLLPLLLLAVPAVARRPHRPRQPRA